MGYAGYMNIVNKNPDLEVLTVALVSVIAYLIRLPKSFNKSGTFREKIQFFSIFFIITIATILNIYSFKNIYPTGSILGLIFCFLLLIWSSINYLPLLFNN